MSDPGGQRERQIDSTERHLREESVAIQMATLVGSADDKRRASEQLLEAYVALQQTAEALDMSFKDDSLFEDFLRGVRTAAETANVLARSFELRYLKEVGSAEDEIKRKHLRLTASLRGLLGDSGVDSSSVVGILGGNGEPREDAVSPERKEGWKEIQRQTAHQSPSLSLPQLQRDIASRHPGEYVVLRDADLLCHTLNEDEATACYYDAASSQPDRPPVFVSPGSSGSTHRPVLRPRTRPKR